MILNTSSSYPETENKHGFNLNRVQLHLKHSSSKYKQPIKVSVVCKSITSQATYFFQYIKKLPQKYQSEAV